MAKFGKVVDSQCLKDLDCVAVCPNQALAYGFTKPSSWQTLNEEERAAQPYSFTRREDMFIAAGALALVVIYRGLYDVIPFLLAVATAVILWALFVTAFRMWRRPTVRFNQLLLKHAGHWSGHGRWFAALVVALAVFSAHSGFVDFQTVAGRRALAPLRVLWRIGRAGWWLIEYCRRERTHMVAKNRVRQLGPLRDGARLDTAICELAELDRLRLEKDGKRRTIHLNPALVGVAP